jgi:hypothetical protein
MSTYSDNLKIELITTGTQAGTWGDTTNTNLGTLIEQAISGYVLQACTGGTDVITIPDGATGVARNMYLQLTGTGGGTLVVPVNKKLYFIYNATSTAITVKVTGLTGVSVPAGAKTILVSNGTDIFDATNYVSSLTLGAALPVTSGGTGVTTSTGTGSNVLSASPTLTGAPLAPTAAGGTNTTQIATTQFVTSAVTTATGSLGTMSTQNANNVAITGGTASGLSSLGVSGTATATTFSGAGTGLTGTASSLSIGGNAATATSATSATSATTATTATNATNIVGSVGQSYQNVTGSRSFGTTYTNSTGRPIWVWYSATSPVGGAVATCYVDGNLACYTNMDLYPRLFACFIVPIGSTYSINSNSNLAYWLELRS